MDPLDNPVLLNLHDSVSRIVDNIGFSVIDDTAHAKLVDVMVRKLSEMSHTCRMLVENGRNAISLNTHVDMKHLYRIHRVDLELMKEYVEQVYPFPPKPEEIHGKVEIDKPKIQKQIKSVPKKAKSPVRRRTPLPIVELPVFDDMDDFDLGFSSRDPPPPPPPLILLPPPPPPPVPPPFLLTFDDLPFEVPVFDPEVPPPNYMTPDVEEVKPVVKLKILQNFVPERKPSRPVKPERKAEKAPSNPSISAPKMTKKRIFQTNYERRLRDEQKACEEMRRERREEKRRLEAEILRKHAEREVEKERERNQQKLAIKIPKEVLDNFYGGRKEVPSTSKVTTKIKKQKTSGAKSSASNSSEKTTKPLLKLAIRYSQINDKQMVIKKVTSKKSRFINGEWQERDCDWKVPRSGVLSEVQTQRKPRPLGAEPIPKLRLVPTSDGEYSIV